LRAAIKSLRRINSMKVIEMTKQLRLMLAGVIAMVLTLLAWIAISPSSAVGVADQSEAKLRLKATFSKICWR
jgi:hypothetical protein